MLLSLFLVSMVLGSSGGSRIDDYIVDVRNTTLISVSSTGRSSYRLDLSGLGLRRINKSAFANVTNVKILNLANNSIGALTEPVFSSLRNLEHLSLADNLIDDFVGAFTGLEKLKTLNISNNPVIVLEPGAFHGLNKTIDIFVLGNSLKKISTDVFDIGKSSRRISTEDEDEDEYEDEDEDEDGDEDKGVDEVKEEGAEPHWRFRVCMNQGKVTILERVMSNQVLQASCSLLKDDDYDVYLNNLGIKAFKRGWYRLPNDGRISRINFSGNDIVRLTPEILNDLPASVREVDLSNNKIESLDQGVIVNTYIKFFDLSNNSISEIESGALAGMNLWQLRLTNNLLKDTRFLATLPTSLNKLFLNRNQIAEFTSDPWVKFRQLQAIDLSDNRITILRKNSLRGLPYLFDLNLSSNRIGTLQPGCFRYLKAMRYLNLRDNEIGDLGAGLFEELSHLSRLDLGENRLTRITAAFRNSLPRDLNTLDLDRNEIGRLENGSFVNVPKRSLNLENNRITSIAKGSFVVPELYGEDLAHEPVDESDILGPLFAGHQLAAQLAALGGVTLPTKPKGIGSVNLSGNPVRRLENGALFGLQRRRHNYVYVSRNSIDLIQGGIFDDGNRRTGSKLETN